MASRDWSQGIGFVYVNVEKLLAESRGMDSVLHPQAAGAKTVHFAAENKKEESAQAIQNIKRNLGKLAELHDRLSAVLQELDDVTGRNK